MAGIDADSAYHPIASSPSILVVGAGAVGGVIAARLAARGHAVTLLDPWFQNVMAIRTNGLTLTTSEKVTSVAVPAITLDELDAAPSPVDVVIFAVKAYDTTWMARLVAPYLADGCLVVSAQDGINEYRLQNLLGDTRVVGCVVTFSSEQIGPGHVIKNGTETWPCFLVGELDGAPSARTTFLADLLGAVGPTRISDNITGELWSKLAINSATNAAAGLTLCTLGDLWADQSALAASIHLAGEVVCVGEAMGFHLEPILYRIPPVTLRDAHLGDTSAWAAAEETMIAISTGGGRGRGNKPSMLQDVLRGRRTEIDFFNGYAVRKGVEARVATPANEAMVRLFKEVELGTLEPHPRNIARLGTVVDQSRGE